MTQAVPHYELYGELLAGQTPDPIHLEPIRERSRKHDWTIRRHSHQRLAQIFLFRTSDVFLNLGDMEYATTHPTLLVVHPGIPHGFKFPEDVVGEVLSVRVDQSGFEPNKNFAPFAAPTAAIFLRPDTQCFDDVVVLFEQLQKAYQTIGRQRGPIMQHLVALITFYLAGEQSHVARPALRKSAETHNLQDKRAQAFCGLLEENFNRQWAVADYAEEMGLSASHLTRLCRNALHASPIHLVRQRRILEAKRLLEYTALPINDVAVRSGFRDIAFFSRTFKSLVGMTPKAYRAQLAR